MHLHIVFYYLLFSIVNIHIAHANVEKTIFLAPQASTIPSEESDLDDLGLERLSPDAPVVRTQLNASFPTNDAPSGTESWFFLENLNPGQRYEVRVCWLATQPTSFTLTTYPLQTVIEDSTLLSSLSIFSTSRLSTLDTRLQTNAIRRSPAKADPAPSTDSVLFLRVNAAADYFTTDEALMDNPSAVTVDLILDPFVLNGFPRSLIPTAGWISVVAVVAVFIAKWVTSELGRVIDDARREGEEEKKDKKER